ncbi:MAG: DUF542 domain-containing protein [Blastocatellia bacterium]|nr:DUF542 domain-containing protein [Blastocatellia bacterium]
MQKYTTRTIGEIAVAQPTAPLVFENLKIDYCCGGHIKFDEACRKAGVEPDVAPPPVEPTPPVPPVEPKK